MQAISFTLKDTLWACFGLHRCRWAKGRWTTRHQNYSIYKEGIREFNSELDWVSIIKSIRRLNLLLSSTAWLSENEAVEKVQVQIIKSKTDFQKYENQKAYQIQRSQPNSRMKI